MIVSDIYEEVRESTGLCDESLIFSTLTRGLEMLANKGLFDKQIGYVDLSVQSGYFIALPRDVKAPIRINIDTNPAFARSRLFEFAANTNGSVEGDENGFQWSDRGNSPIQDETKLPGVIKYVCADAADAGKTAKITGTNEEGRTITETLIAGVDPDPSTNEFFSITRVLRDATTAECSITCQDEIVARYYGDEIEPNYRVIKLSKTATVVRMMYRKHVFKITSLEDPINLDSGMAVVLAARAARDYALRDYANAAVALGEAEKILNEEQAARDEGITTSQDVITATNTNITTVGAIIVADIYDVASEIFGSIGRGKLFDKITSAIEALANKAHWDSLLGTVDIWRSENYEEVNPSGSAGTGIYVLPRYVGTILAVNLSGNPMIPRNKWSEFHINGPGEKNTSRCNTWHSIGEVVTINRMPLDATTRRPIPQALVAIPDSSADDGTEIKVYGLLEGREVTVVPPCVFGSEEPDDAQPLIDTVTRIVKGTSTASIKLICDNADQTLLGYYYPDEMIPSYQAIRIPTKSTKRIRVLYRKPTAKVSSLYDPIHLRSRLAMEAMMRAVKAQETDPAAAVAFEGLAVQYLRDEKMATNPAGSVGLQFDRATSPALTYNVQ